MTFDEWEGAQQKLHQVSKATARYVYLLSGILTCDHCGGKMSGGGTGHNKARPYYGYYYCTSMRKGLCTCKSVRSQRLEQAVLAQVTKYLAAVEDYDVMPVASVDSVKLRAPPGPKADAALRRYWARAYEVAVEILARQARQEPAASTSEDDEKPKEQRP